MKKRRGLTDDEVQEELEQIALERQMIEDSSFSVSGDNPPYSNSNSAEEDVFVDDIEEDVIEEEKEIEEEVINDYYSK